MFLKEKLIFDFIPQTKDYIGYFFILLGLIVYPIMGYLTNAMGFIRII